MLFLIQKEFKQIFRNKFLPKLIFVFPIMVILVMPWVANMEIKNVTLGILDFDKSSTSRDLSNKISASNYFKLTLSPTSRIEADNCIAKNQCDIIMEIPNGFERSLVRERNATIGIYANSINVMKGTLGSGYLSSIIMDFALNKANEKGAIYLQGNMQGSFGDSQATLQDLIQQSLGISQDPAQTPRSTYRFNPNLDYKIYMIPALMVMVLTLVCGFLPAFNIVAEKEKGNIEQINVTPISKFQFIISKLIPYWIIGLLIVSLCMILAYFVYNLAPRGSIVLIYLYMLCYIFVVTGMGLVISNYSNTMQQAMFVCYFFILILILLSGLLTSLKSMPQWAYTLTYFNPLRYFIESLRILYLKGAGIESLWQNLFVLVIFALILNFWAIMSYKKRG